jgi:hypothetical protein
VFQSTFHWFHWFQWQALVNTVMSSRFSNNALIWLDEWLTRKHPDQWKLAVSALRMTWNKAISNQSRWSVRKTHVTESSLVSPTEGRSWGRSFSFRSCRGDEVSPLLVSSWPAATYSTWYSVWRRDTPQSDSGILTHVTCELTEPPFKVFILYFIFFRYMFRPSLNIFRRNTQFF